MKIGLKVVQPFNQFGYACHVGAVVPEEEWKRWMTEEPLTVNNRLNNGFVKWTPIVEEDDEIKGPEVDFMTKDQLADFAEQELDVKLDRRMSVENLREQVRAMLQRKTMLLSLDAKRAASLAETAEIEQRAGKNRPAAPNARTSSAPAAPPKKPPTVTGEAPPVLDGDELDRLEALGASGGANAVTHDPPAALVPTTAAVPVKSAEKPADK